MNIGLDASAASAVGLDGGTEFIDTGAGSGVFALSRFKVCTAFGDIGPRSFGFVRNFLLATAVANVCRCQFRAFSIDGVSFGKDLGPARDKHGVPLPVERDSLFDLVGT